MAELGVPGVSSQYDQYIERLVELAKVRRKPIEERLEQSKLRKSVWMELNNRLLKLEEASRQLYGLNNVFRDRMATSTNEDVAIVRPRRDIEPVDMQIQVKQIASADRFSSQPVDVTRTIEAGIYQFRVGDEEINVNFAGGDLRAFSEALNAINPEVLRSSVVQSHANQQTIFLESRLIGAQNAIDFEGKAKELAFDLGLITDQVDLTLRVESDSRSANAVGRLFDPKEELLLSSGRTVALAVEVDDDRIQEGAILRLQYSTQDRPRPNVAFLAAADRQNVDQALREGRLTPVTPDNIPYDLPVSSPNDNVFLRINDRLVALSSLANTAGEDGMIELSLDQFAGQRLQGIVLNNQDGVRDITINSMELSFPNLTDWTPINAVSRAQDAEFNIDGVDVTRDTNVIEDLVPGQTIELRSASDEVVDLSVKYDTEKATRAIEEFLFYYNWTVFHINAATTIRDNESILETGYYTTERDVELAKEILGLMQGDQQLNGLKSRMQSMMISAYPIGVDGEEQYIFANMGVSTRRLNSSASGADRLGYFNIHDQDRFEFALNESWEDVRDFFARAPLSQGVYETGLVRGRMPNPNPDPTKEEDQFLPTGLSATASTYTFGPRSVIATRSQQLDSEIKRHTDALTAFDEDLERKRQQWIRDFAAAENAQREMERLQSQIEGMNRSQNNR
ncbi:flagellar filament capping protein FliD [Entomospira culicis]|uniref:Flagellar hook-associated protein 2 n=1 Tax=Entomospira culicis TaxID=2719989 RepID=A0A968KTZ9_9SPIO|nr:flagellar filament capping protein FliD [Entomospira culicis]NIZ18444.1 flagellar filament capping protein FliD [Entomospira culicis]NIZ68660.1 flagellar filament capping protein FliD [Entomospira culicis]WDI37259.1 flagellar filament capping protein FliD [Entomospira culicis]WDI38888.1 flagellar filament capping protein FliD [Entomospira culicis]